MTKGTVLFLFSCCYTGWMSSRYDARRSVTDKSLHVIYAAGTFDRLPTPIRCLGPWQGLSGGDIDRLKPHYRLLIAEQGFVLVYQHLAAFSAGA